MGHGSSDVPDGKIVSEWYVSERNLIGYAAVETRRQNDEGEGSCQDSEYASLKTTAVYWMIYLLSAVAWVICFVCSGGQHSRFLLDSHR